MAGVDTPTDDYGGFDFTHGDVLDLAAQDGPDLLLSLPDHSTVRLLDFDIGLLGTDDIVI